MTGTDPAAGAEAARAAAAHSRRAGGRDNLVIAVANLATALLMSGDWDGAEAELAQAADAARRCPAAQAALAGLGDLRATEDSRTRRSSRSRRCSPPPPAASPPPRCATPVLSSIRSAP